MFGTLTILVIILAIVITSQNISKKNGNKSDESALNSFVTKSPTPSPTSSLTPTPSDTPIITPTPSPTIASTSTSTPQQNNSNQSNIDFKYPNSTTISQNGSETIYESTDDPAKITDWYKDKIKNAGMKATSFVQTSTNGNILNKLVGANSDKKITVEINKQNNSSAVKIVVVSN